MNFCVVFKTKKKDEVINTNTKKKKNTSFMFKRLHVDDPDGAVSQFASLWSIPQEEDDEGDEGDEGDENVIEKKKLDSVSTQNSLKRARLDFELDPDRTKSAEHIFVPLPKPVAVFEPLSQSSSSNNQKQVTLGAFFQGRYDEYDEPNESIEEEKEEDHPGDMVATIMAMGEDDLFSNANMDDFTEESEDCDVQMKYADKNDEDDSVFVGASEKERPEWMRPVVKNLPNPKEEDFVFQHIDTTYAINKNTKEPVIRVWGCTSEGQSVLLEVPDFKPYFYAQLPYGTDIEQVCKNMDAYLSNKDRSKNKMPNYVLNAVKEHKRSIRGYHRDADLSVMYKFVMSQPGYVAKARDALEFANKSVVAERCATYEGNVPFALRYMVDSKLGGCQWMRLPKTKYQTESSRYGKKSRCQIEVKCNWKDVIPIDTDDEEHEGGALAPMRVLSFDIEVYRKERGFPKAEENPVITICTALSVIGKGILHKAVFTTAPKGKGCADVPDADMHVFEHEIDLLRSFTNYVIQADPDAFTGWNIEGFDWPYMFKRAEVLHKKYQEDIVINKKLRDEIGVKLGKAQIDNNESKASRLKLKLTQLNKEWSFLRNALNFTFAEFSRMLGKKAYLREKTFNSKAYGAKKSYEMMCDGRFNYDGLIFMLRGQMTKYRSYKLNAISQEILGDSKVDVGYDQIPILYDGTDTDRARLSFYCLKDSILPLDLLDKLMAFINGIEQSRVTGVPLKWLLSRGQGVKTFSNLLRYKMDCELVPSKSSDSNSAFTAGGHVEEPIRGYYTVPIATLDFASLYPSIMIAYNVSATMRMSRFFFVNVFFYVFRFVIQQRRVWHGRVRTSRKTTTGYHLDSQRTNQSPTFALSRPTSGKASCPRC